MNYQEQLDAHLDLIQKLRDQIDLLNDKIDLVNKKADTLNDSFQKLCKVFTEAK